MWKMFIQSPTGHAATAAAGSAPVARSRSAGAAILASFAVLATLGALGAAAVALQPAPAAARPQTATAALDALSGELRQWLDDRRGADYRQRLARLAAPELQLTANPDVELMYVAGNGQPMYFTAFNLNAARTIATDQIWPGGGAALNLDGSATQPGELGLWDLAQVKLDHPEFQGRVTQTDTTASFAHRHSTNVAGTMVAAGLDTAARGMAYAAPLTAYNWHYDTSEMAAAAAAGMKVSNHSYGYLRGWFNGYLLPQYNPPVGSPYGSAYYWFGDRSISATEDSWFGFYIDYARQFDAIAYEAPYYTIVKAAGNERLAEAPAPGSEHYHLELQGSSWVWVLATDTHPADAANDGGYDTLPPISTAKNPIAVGACEDIPGGWTQPSDVVLAGYTSWGPTDDGRIKPDLVANGTALYTTNNLASPLYATFDGTSAAAPTVAGTVDLLIQHYEATHGGQSPLSSTVKAVLVQTADEYGNPGPDYEAGWGLVDARAAAAVISDDASSQRIVESLLEDGGRDTFFFYSDGSGSAWVTIAWTDPPGTPPAGGLDPPDPMLVHDMDLRIEHLASHTTAEPWILDPANPAAAATTGDNARDNVEQVAIAAPQAGYYAVTVQHKGALSASQWYSLVSSEPLVCVPQWLDATSGPLGGNGAGMGTAWGDYDGDGDDDLYLSRGAAPNALLRNDGGGAFTDVTTPPLDHAGSGRGAYWGDFDDDGDLDLYLCNYDFMPNKLFRNDGGGAFSDITTPVLAGSDKTLAAALADYDLDGDLDIYVVNFQTADRLLRNEGDGQTFTDVTATPLGDAGRSYAAAWGDFDNDRDPDLYLARTNVEANRLYRNDGGGAFSDITSGPLGDTGNGTGVAWGDYDNDGDLDLHVSNYDTYTNRLLRNEGDGQTFIDVTAGPLAGGALSYGCAWGDTDNDGWLDLIVANTNGYTNRLLRNQGGGSFADVTVDPLGMTVFDQVVPVTMVDADGDGDLDIYAGTLNAPNRYFENPSCPNHWFAVRLHGTQSNSGGIGARLSVTAGSATQIREVTAGSGSASQNPLTAHFGLGDATTLGLRIDWPSGAVQEFSGLAADQLFVAQEPPAGGGCDPAERVENGDFATGDLPPWQTSIGGNPGHPVPQIVVEDVGGAPLALHVTRALDFDGSHAVAYQALDPVGPASGCPELRLALDLRIDDHNFAGYDGWNAYPANVWVHYDDDNGDPQVFRRSFYVFVDPGQTPDPPPLAEQIPQSQWVHREYDLADLQPALAAVTQVDVGARGWSYDVAFDNISLVAGGGSSGVGPPAATPPAPTASRLLGNFPNPFNPSTTIRFDLAAPGAVTLEIYDVRGALARRLLRGTLPAGRHALAWDGRDGGGRGVASGIYIVRLEAPAYAGRHKMLLIK